MQANIVTTEDLKTFKTEILEAIESFLIKHNSVSIDKWIRSDKVIEKLGISPGTLQNFRINKTIPFTKLGGILFYDEKEIHQLLIDNKSSSKSKNNISTRY